MEYRAIKTKVEVCSKITVVEELSKSYKIYPHQSFCYRKRLKKDTLIEHQFSKRKGRLFEGSIVAREREELRKIGMTHSPHP